MQILGVGILTWIVFLPVVAMIFVLFVPKGREIWIKWISVVATGIQVILAVILLLNYRYDLAGINTLEGFQFVEKYRWIDVSGVAWFGRIVIEYFLGVDGLSMPMVVLTALISFIGAIASWELPKTKGYYALYLLLDTGMMGVFVALDFFLFYIFWEVMLLPMYFLIGIWGGPRREYAAIKFFIYTLFGSVLMLLVMIGLYFSTSIIDPVTGEKVHTFNMLAMMDPKNYEPGSIFSGLHTTWRYIAYIALFIGFAIKVPIVPFHTWLPDAHVEAPTPISVILAGILLKMGTYGMLRISFPIFPDGMIKYALPMAILGFINIVYGALAAMAQEDFKKLIAYSSISHMGYVVLGMAALNTQGVTGAIMQMFNHGTITAMLFLIVGVLYDRAHTRGLDEFGGLANQMPKYFGIVIIAFFAALGLPGLSGFISEAFVFLGAFQTYKWIAIFSATGVIITAGYILWTTQRLFFGQLPERWKNLPDINARELVTLVPLAIIVIFLGVYPSPLINLMNTSVNHLVRFVSEMGQAGMQLGILP